MSLIKKTIFTGLSPNMIRGDIPTALKFLLLPWKWYRIRTGGGPEKAEHWLKRYFGIAHAIACDSGRSALFLALQALGVGEGDIVLLQAYTCVVVTNAIRFTGAMPVYVDVLPNANMDPEDLKKKITVQSKVLIIQHTFGKTAKLDELLAIAKEHNLLVVEDCAHALGTEYRGKKVGTFGDIAMLSFGSEKVISCARGGAVITNNDMLGKKLEELKTHLRPTPLGMVLQHLLHYPLFWLGRVLYGVGLGKIILWKVKLLHIVHRIIYPPEKRGRRMRGLPALLPNSLAEILLNQLGSLQKINEHRLRIGRLYEQKLGVSTGISPSFIPLRFPLFVDTPKVLIVHAKKEGILLGDWYNSVVAPDDSAPSATLYNAGTCLMAEKLASQSVNLPTDVHVSEDDVDRIVACIKDNRLDYLSFRA